MKDGGADDEALRRDGRIEARIVVEDEDSAHEIADGCLPVNHACLGR